MVLVAIAGNKVEGLALAKLTNFFVLGLLFSWFIDPPFKYISGVLPTFWHGELIQGLGQYLGQHWVAMLPASTMGIVSSLIWIILLQRMF